VNYDVPQREINDDGQLDLDTYKQIQSRLKHRTVCFFTERPASRANALIVILPINHSLNIHHQDLFDILYEQVKRLSDDDNIDIHQRILSLEFVPSTCVFGSLDLANYFVVDCDRIETKQHLLSSPLRFTHDHQSFPLELHSYDEYIQREYDKYLKAEKYKELIKQHEQAIRGKPKKQ
jgi:hypothetical protein